MQTIAGADQHELKKEKNAIILAHYYQTGDIQDVADMVGDSYGLSKRARDNDADIIVFCGVKFMAESAKILSPQKTVLLPAADAGCPMADMVTPEDIKRLREEYPLAAVVCYVNSTAEVKAECDVCCTSSNAVAVVRSLAQKSRSCLFPTRTSRAMWPHRCLKSRSYRFADTASCTTSWTHRRRWKPKPRKPDAPLLVHPRVQSRKWWRSPIMWAAPPASSILRPDRTRKS